MPILDGDILRIETIIVFEGAVRTKLQKQAHCLRMTFCGCLHQRRGAGVGLGIHILRSSLEKRLKSIKAVAGSSQVDGHHP